MIEVHGLTKRYGDKVAVKDLTFTVQPGHGHRLPRSERRRQVDDHADDRRPGRADRRVGAGQRPALPATPWRRWPSSGILLEARAVHTSRSACNHLLALAQTNGVPRVAVDEVIDLVGLREVARKRAGGFSLGMGQRLGIASALLGDPQTVVLDEPVNGLDPEGIQWVRTCCRASPREGRTVFVSSHLMSEMSLTADHLIVVGRGRADRRCRRRRVRGDGLDEHRAGAHAAGGRIARAPARARRDGHRVGAGRARGAGPHRRADRRPRLRTTDPGARARVQQASLEEAFMEMTTDSVEFHAHTPNSPRDRAAAAPSRRARGSDRA